MVEADAAVPELTEVATGLSEFAAGAADAVGCRSVVAACVGAGAEVGEAAGAEDDVGSG